LPECLHRAWKRECAPGFCLVLSAVLLVEETRLADRDGGGGQCVATRDGRVAVWSEAFAQRCPCLTHVDDDLVLLPRVQPRLVRQGGHHQTSEGALTEPMALASDRKRGAQCLSLGWHGPRQGESVGRLHARSLGRDPGTVHADSAGQVERVFGHCDQVESLAKRPRSHATSSTAAQCIGWSRFLPARTCQQWWLDRPGQADELWHGRRRQNRDDGSLITIPVVRLAMKPLPGADSEHALPRSGDPLALCSLGLSRVLVSCPHPYQHGRPALRSLSVRRALASGRQVSHTFRRDAWASLIPHRPHRFTTDFSAACEGAGIVYGSVGRRTIEGFLPRLRLLWVSGVWADRPASVANTLATSSASRAADRQDDSVSARWCVRGARTRQLPWRVSWKSLARNVVFSRMRSRVPPPPRRQRSLVAVE
jgi:hypothetical protein